MNLYELYSETVKNWPLLSSFIKFGILATLGEITAYRIVHKRFPDKSFGAVPKFFVWGLLGILIFWAFKIFSGGINGMVDGGMLPVIYSEKFFRAFYISLFMNMIFGTFLMLTHRLTDIKIESTGGALLGILSPKPAVPELFKKVDWDRFWGFVIKKTIPFFWIPAHTITFLLPPEMRVLFAAILSFALGVILAFGAVQKTTEVKKAA